MNSNINNLNPNEGEEWNREIHNKIKNESGRDSKYYECATCHFETSNFEDLESHSNSHKPYKCGHCNYRSTHKSGVIRHMVVHNGYRRYKCDRCDYRAVQKSDITKHMTCHTGKKPYECDECGFRTSQSSNLAMHKRKHQEEDEYIYCNYCPYITTKKYQSIQHIESHCVLACDFCDYKAKTGYEIGLHIMEVHEKTLKIYDCQFCLFSCITEDYLQSHRDAHHKKRVKKNPNFVDVEHINRSHPRYEFYKKEYYDMQEERKYIKYEVVFFCDMCAIVTNNNEELIFHKQDIHYNEESSEEYEDEYLDEYKEENPEEYEEENPEEYEEENLDEYDEKNANEYEEVTYDDVVEEQIGALENSQVMQTMGLPRDSNLPCDLCHYYATSEDDLEFHKGHFHAEEYIDDGLYSEYINEQNGVVYGYPQQDANDNIRIEEYHTANELFWDNVASIYIDNRQKF